jgi:type I restriction enzyme R subunit
MCQILPMANEADTCRKYVTPKLIAAGWDEAPHSFTEQKTFTDGRILITGNQARRGIQKRADYLLRYQRNFPIAVVEAKPDEDPAGDGVQQAKEYAEILGLKFAFATNGREIIEIDFINGLETLREDFPTPHELLQRYEVGHHINSDIRASLLTPYNNLVEERARYYQEIAINRVVQDVLQGKRRILITMATGTGKTFVAFQICWKLWNARWNRTNDYRHPKILFLADRNILIDDPKDKMFAGFGDARHKIGDSPNEPVMSREMYFAIYQAIAKDSRRPGLYRQFPPDFFDLVIVDECHRGSARDESNWREILEYFAPAFQLGMTATPLREDNRDTYKYFGNPIYQYSLRQGIEDGFLAPYRVHRVLTDYDAHGWRPGPNVLDRYRREIPDTEYHTRDFERLIALRARSVAIARHLTEFMKKTDRFAKTIVFCVTQEHADEMRRAINNLNPDLTRRYPDYVCRVTSEEGQIGRAHLSHFQDLERITPVVLTTSKLLTTGVNMPMCKNIVIARVVNAMTEFKQIIGRGTRVRDDYGKLYFNILDYTGSATRLFADPEFDGYPALLTEEEIDKYGRVIPGTEKIIDEDDEQKLPTPPEGEVYPSAVSPEDEDEFEPRRYYYDEGYVEIVSHLVYELDPEGNRLSVIELTDYAGKTVRTLYPNAVELRRWWTDPRKRSEIIEELERRGIEFEFLAEAAKQPEADPFDLLCHLAFNAPLRSRAERADRVRREEYEFFGKYGTEAKAILEQLLAKYAQHGTAQFMLPDALKIPPISNYGNVAEITNLFGGALELRRAVTELQNLIYEE